MENSPTRATTRQNADGVSPANLAAQKDSSECLRVLCQSWAGVNNEAEKYMESPDSSGNSPYLTSIIHDSFNSLIFLNSMQISDARLSEVAQEHDNLACKIALKLTEANLSSINYIIPSPGRESHGSFPSGRADILEEIVRAGQLDLLDKMLGKVTRDNRGVQHMVVGRSDQPLTRGAYYRITPLEEGVAPAWPGNVRSPTLCSATPPGLPGLQVWV